VPLKRNTKQSAHGTLEVHYKLLPEGKTNSAFQRISKNMLAFIEMVNQAFTETTIWAITADEAIILQNEDNHHAEAYIMIHNTGDNFYYFEYLMQAEKSPWPNATVKGAAKDLEEAKKYLLIAMNECGGWQNNNELEKLLKI
jgi:hypothetical protein